MAGIQVLLLLSAGLVITSGGRIFRRGVEQCDINIPRERNECKGVLSSVTESECVALDCCYKQPPTTDIPACYEKKIDPCVAPVGSLPKKCGFPGWTANLCHLVGCCYADGKCFRPA